eukprot:TRINITY_DN1944_c1_g1_i1.p1 TRINITY_DN1944_c1_g1~~TRINITY_DN1944_c1_g1_i1.p1  ORF type:complete len:786 (+),score=174.34 TRINITY_DN1944_c1_g1_i1:55-2412(+)
METVDQELIDGVRCTADVWPNSSIEAAKNIMPYAYMYTPLRQRPNMGTLAYEPSLCRCGGVLNSCSRDMIDYNAKTWKCCFCGQLNHFRKDYAENIGPNSLPAELISSTVEYSLPFSAHRNESPPKPVFMFVVDTAIPEKELNALKDTVGRAFMQLDEDSVVGLITFGKGIQVHILGSTFCPQQTFLHEWDNATLDKERICKLLELPYFERQKNEFCDPFMTSHEVVFNNYMVPIRDSMFEQAMDDLVPDLWMDEREDPHDRYYRCTGTALNVASVMMESLARGIGGRIMLFTGGPCTIGKGRVVSVDFHDMMRSTDEIENNKLQFYRSEVVQYYESISERSAKAGHVIDIFACSLDQVGLVEMQSCFTKSGGMVVLGDSFGQSMVQESVSGIFNKYDYNPLANGYEHPDHDHLRMALNATITVLCSPEIKLSGCLGPCRSGNKILNPEMVDDSDEIGETKTQVWHTSSLLNNTSFAFFCHIVDKKTTNDIKTHFIQFKTLYQHPSGERRLRVTTQSRKMVKMDMEDERSTFAYSLDGECIGVVAAKQAVHQCSIGDRERAIKRMDALLVRICARFGDLRPKSNMTTDLTLPDSIHMLPMFVYMLRRSSLVQTFNCSPDESIYYAGVFGSLNTSDGAVCVHPSMFAYDLGKEGGMPVALDSQSIGTERVLLLDTYFRVVIFHGKTTAAWRDCGYHLEEDYSTLADQLTKPQEDAQTLMADRLPVPRFIVCDQGKSQARFLLSKLNPSLNLNNSNDDRDCTRLLSEQVNFDQFFTSLKGMIDHYNE